MRLFSREPIAAGPATAAAAQSDLAKEAARIKAEAEQRAKETLNRLIVEDEAERIAARDYVPEITVTEHRSGKYITFGTIDVLAAIVEKIEVDSPGWGPHMVPNPSKSIIWLKPGDESLPGYLPTTPTPARIKVTTISGGVHSRQICRHKAGIALAALLKTWRECR